MGQGGGFDLRLGVGLGERGQRWDGQAVVASDLWTGCRGVFVSGCVFIRALGIALAGGGGGTIFSGGFVEIDVPPVCVAVGRGALVLGAGVGVLEGCGAGFQEVLRVGTRRGRATVGPLPFQI